MGNQVVFCDTCTASSEFLSAADDASPPNGTSIVLVFNVSESVVRAYSVEFLDSGLDGGEKMITSMSVPERATNALNYYNKLLEESGLDDASPYTLNKSVATSYSSTTYEGNGCGNDTFSAYIPDTPFKSACDSHDICYTTSSSKSACDTAFLSDMIDIVDDIADLSDIGQAMLDFDIIESLALAMTRKFLLDMAATYHWAVVNSDAALISYCNSTTKVNASECGSLTEADVGSNTGTVTSTSNNDGYTVTTICELWAFPDGSGGVYYMWRNCRYAIDV